MDKDRTGVVDSYCRSFSRSRRDNEAVILSAAIDIVCERIAAEVVKQFSREKIKSASGVKTKWKR